MFGTHQISQIVFGFSFARDGDLTTVDVAGATYVGLGDQFDDDRRFVHETARRVTASLALAAGTARS